MYKVMNDEQRVRLTSDGHVIYTVLLKDGTEVDVCDFYLMDMEEINMEDVDQNDGMG